MTIRTLVVDDQSMVRAGLRMLLAEEADIDVVAEAGNGLEAISQAARFHPDVVLMDIRMPELSGIEATREIVAAHPEAGVLVVTMLDDDDSVFAAMRAGARGYLLKGASPEELERAVRAVANGEVLLAPAIAGRAMAYMAGLRSGGPAPFPDLTAREREVLDLVAAGLDNVSIARRLTVSSKTVRNHLSNILTKLQVADRAQAIVRAREAGLGQC